VQLELPVYFSVCVCVHGHTLDLIITLNDLPVAVLPTDPPIRQSTVTASLPVIVPRRSVPFQVFDPVTDSEVQSLLAATPATYWPLDPIPTWLLKEIAPYTVPVMQHICNLSLQTGSFPTALKQALVQPRVKSPALDPDQVKSYRLISNLPYVFKVVEYINSENELSLMLDQQPGINCHRTFVHRPL